MYIALYRKWRPAKFSDVCGQEAITDILKNEISKNTVSHAYLFCGLRGTGKTTCAKILAKAVNCENTKDGEPCGECENCKAAERGALLDIVEMDAASNTGVENIRSIIDEVSFLPSQGKRKVYIIDEVHMLSGGAFNALLKTLEEPPEHVIFILCTTETHKIPATILSRCQRFDFGRISIDDISARLKFIAEKENISITDGAASLIARLAEGAMRDALSLLELCAGQGKTLDYEDACALLGVPDKDSFHRLCSAFAKSDTPEALALINTVLAKGKATTVCAELIEFFRDLLVVSTASRAADLLSELPEEIEKLKQTASMFTSISLLYCVSVLEKTLITLASPNVNARTTLEMTAIRLCNIEKTKDVEALFSRVEALEKAIKSGTFAPATAKPAEQPEKKEAPVKKESAKPLKAPREPQNAPAPTETLSAKAFERWEEFVDAVALEDKVAKSFVALGRGFIKGNELEIIIEDNMSAAMLARPTRMQALKAAAKAVCGVPMEVTVTVKKTAKEADSGLLD